MNLIGLTGTKGAGKDSLGRAIRRADPRFKVYHFADPLKNLVMAAYGLSYGQVHHPQRKEERFRAPLHIDSAINYFRRETGLWLPRKSLRAHSPRELLQLVGTEYIRAYNPTYWVDQLRTQLKGQTHAIVADVRFADEAALIRELGGSVVKVVRVDAQAPSDSHSSESLSGIEPDLTVAIKTGDLACLERWGRLLAI